MTTMTKTIWMIKGRFRNCSFVHIPRDNISLINRPGISHIESYQTNHPLFQGHKNLKHKRCLFMESNRTVHGSYGVHETWFLLLTYWESLQTPLVVDDQTNHSTHLFAALLPSSNQTWLAGKFHLLGWFFPQMPMFLRISQPRLMTLENMIHFPTAISSPPTSGFVWKWSHWNSIMWHCIPWYSMNIH